MALYGTVGSDYRVIDGSNEVGTYTFNVQSTTLEDGVNVPVQYIIEVSYTDVRTTTKYYSLTKAAIDTYIAANPTLNINYYCTDEYIDAYEMTVVSVTRTITSATMTLLDTSGGE
jgi:hypothetical protein